MPFPLETGKAERVVLYGSVLLVNDDEPSTGRGAFLDDPTDTDGSMSITRAAEGDYALVVHDAVANQELDFVSAHISTETAEFSIFDVECGAYTASTKTLLLWVSSKDIGSGGSEALAAAADGAAERLNIVVVFNKQANLATE